jgi:hypothetical protein
MEMDTTENNRAEQAVEVEEEDMSDLRVVSDYRHPSSSASSGRNAEGGGLVMVDPISGKAVPVSEMSEHMRIQLLDPRWREQQQRFVDKQRETGFADGGSIADSLTNFARKRGDIFGQAANGSGPNSAAAIAEREALEKRKSEVKTSTFIINVLVIHSHHPFLYHIFFTRFKVKCSGTATMALSEVFRR